MKREPRVWKIGSRWDDYGNRSKSILHIFRRNGYVFVGSKAFKDVIQGDYIAIADGKTVVSVAKVLDEKPTELCELLADRKLRFREEDAERFDFHHPEYWKEDYFGTRVHIVDLLPYEQFHYDARVKFCSANAIWDDVIERYERNATQPFDIAARTLRLKNVSEIKDNIGYEKLELLDGKTVYNIPVYQREYSWGEEQLRRFVRDIFTGYWGVSPEETSIVKEPLFIGTMQLSQKRHVSDHESEQDIIDGQQRTSSLLCLLKFLKLSFPESRLLNGFRFNWLHTMVNNGKEESYLQELCRAESLDAVSPKSTNIYLRNCAIIGQTIFQSISDEEGSVYPYFKIDDFCEYLFSSIYFVVVETVAGLSKTIQIFNTINTAGLDLQGNDLFKVRLYEYLHDKCNEGDEVFNEIGKRYERVKVINEQWREQGHEYDIVSLGTVRDVYKDYIISRFDLNNHTSLYPMGTDTFFDRLFDILLGIQEHKEFGKDVKQKVKLSLDDFDRIIDAVSEWNKSGFENNEELIAYELFNKTYYSWRYLRICYLMVAFGLDIHAELYKVLLPLAKIYFCHSIYNAKSIYEMHSFSYTVMKLIGRLVTSGSRDGAFKELLKAIEDKLDAAKYGLNGIELCGHFLKSLPWNRPRWRDLMCCLSAWLYENESGTPVDELQAKITKGTYKGHKYEYDYEHIRANNDPGVTDDDPLQDTIGNLVLLESDINRSIQDIPFDQKVNRRDGRICYKDSGYVSVQQLRQYSKWGQEEILARRDDIYRRILTFLWGSEYCSTVMNPS